MPKRAPAASAAVGGHNEERARPPCMSTKPAGGCNGSAAGSSRPAALCARSGQAQPQAHVDQGRCITWILYRAQVAGGLGGCDCRRGGGRGGSCCRRLPGHLHRPGPGCHRLAGRPAGCRPQTLHTVCMHAWAASGAWQHAVGQAPDLHTAEAAGQRACRCSCGKSCLSAWLGTVLRSAQSSSLVGSRGPRVLPSQPRQLT